jgi:hypothetical protein
MQARHLIAEDLYFRFRKPAQRRQNIRRAQPAAVKRGFQDGERLVQRAADDAATSSSAKSYFSTSGRHRDGQAQKSRQILGIKFPTLGAVTQPQTFFHERATPMKMEKSFAAKTLEQFLVAGRVVLGILDAASSGARSVFHGVKRNGAPVVDGML